MIITCIRTKRTNTGSLQNNYSFFAQIYDIRSGRGSKGRPPTK